MKTTTTTTATTTTATTTAAAAYAAAVTGINALAEKWRRGAESRAAARIERAKTARAEQARRIDGRRCAEEVRLAPAPKATPKAETKPASANEVKTSLDALKQKFGRR